MSFITPLLPNQASIERIAAKSRQIMIGTYIIDAALTEEHNFDSDVTEYPVEQGGDVTDNIRPKPITVTIEGIVSDTPIGKMVDIRVNQGDNGQLDFTPSADALAALTAIRDARLPVPIVTSLKAYDNMAMTSLKIPRDAATGAALRFTAEFQQIIFVTNNRTTVRVATPAAGKQVAQGNKPPISRKLIKAKIDPGDGAWFDENAPNPSLGAGARGRWRFGAQPLPDGTWRLTDGQFTKTDAQEAADNSGLVSLDPKTRLPITNPGQTFILSTGVR